MLRSHLAFMQAFVSATARKHFIGFVFSRITPSFTARACLVATRRSKSLLGRASQPLSFRNRPPKPASLCSTALECCFCSHSVRSHCSGVLGSHRALEIIARAGFSLFATRSPFRNRSSLNRALLRAVATLQAL